MIDDDIENINIDIPQVPLNALNKFMLANHDEANIEFKVPLASMTPSDVYSQPPITYKIDSIKSIKEEKIGLTAPMFCKLRPSVQNFNVTNNTQLEGAIQKSLNNGG